MSSPIRKLSEAGKAAAGGGVSETIVDTGSLAIAGEQRSGESPLAMARLLAWIYGSQMTCAELVGPLLAGALAATNIRLLFLVAGGLYAVAATALTRGTSQISANYRQNPRFSLSFLGVGFRAIITSSVAYQQPSIVVDAGGWVSTGSWSRSRSSWVAWTTNMDRPVSLIRPQDWMVHG